MPLESPKTPVNPAAQWVVVATFVAAVIVWAYATLTGHNPDPPPAFPSVPSVQAIPPNHTAMIETDAAGKVRMSVAPNP